MEKIYTIGTAQRTIDEFINVLNANFIEAVLDVRSYPSSRLEHFRQINLKQILCKNTIEYFYLGKELGGFRKEGYKQYMHSREFKQGILSAQNIASKKLSVLLCAERSPAACHRRFIGAALRRNGWIIEHIVDQETLW